MKKLLLLAGLLLLMTSALSADPSIFGMTGLIGIPDDQVTANHQLNLTANYFDFDKGSGWSAGGAYGIIPNLEVSALGFDNGDDTDFVANVKYKLLSESNKYPGVAIGGADLCSKICDDPSFFVVAGKDLGSAFDSFGNSSFSLKAYVGAGTKMYKGIFAGLSWAATQKLDVMGEYNHSGLGLYGDDSFNVAAQYKFNNGVSAKAGVMDMSDFFCGVNYSMSVF